MMHLAAKLSRNIPTKQKKIPSCTLVPENQEVEKEKNREKGPPR